MSTTECVTNLQVGSYTFDPVPANFNISHEFVRTSSGQLINVISTANLEGRLVLTNKCRGISLVNDLREQMESALIGCSGCQLMVLSCGTDILLQAYVQVNDLQFTPTSDNWTDTMGYSVSFR